MKTSDLITTDELFALLGCSRRTLAKYRPGGLKSKPYLFDRSAVQPLLDTIRRQQTAEAAREEGLSLWLVRDRNEPGGILEVHLNRADAEQAVPHYRRTYRRDEDGREVRTVAYVEKVRAVLMPAG